MNRIKNRLEKKANVSIGSYNLKCLCVDKILETWGVKLVGMEPSDVVDYLSQNNEITFDNVEDLLETWVEDTRENYPEHLN